jgi:hypothetical protein
MPIAQITDARTRKQSVNIPRALVKRPGRRADENDCLIGGDVHAKVKGTTVRLTDDSELRSPCHA